MDDREIDRLIAAMDPVERSAAISIAAERMTRDRIEDYRPYAKQLQFHALGATMRERLLRAGNQNGKAQPIDEPVLTPLGWRRIGDLRPGDEVIAGDGAATTVTGVYPRGALPIFRVVFDDGASTRCCDEHLWVTKQGKRERFGDGGWSVRTLAEIRAFGGNAPPPIARAAIPVVGNVEFSPTPVPVDPYLLGVLLGDGGMTGSGITLTSADEEIVQSARKSLPPGCKISKVATRYGWSIAKSSGRTNPLKSLLVGLGLFGLSSENKFVPDEYLFNDHDTRLSVLQGLLDTDGSVSKVGDIEYSSISDRLADAVQFLVQSFGGKVTRTRRTTSCTHCGIKVAGAPSWRIRIRLPQVVPFRLERKISRLKRPTSRADTRFMRRIEPSGIAECVCISVAHYSRTYVTKDFIVTHNSFCVGAEASYHLTGRYPDWWEGRRFTRPTVVWASGETAEATRDNPQRVLLGLPGETGTGSLPFDTIGEYGLASGTADLYDYVKVKHHTNGVFDGWSMLRLKYYAQGRRKWQGPPVDFVWFDEEPPEEIYDEGLARTIATGGMASMSFTPLQGMSSVVLRFLGKDRTPDRADVNMTIEDALHISAEERDRIIASFPAHEREARAKGIPTLGSGRIFPIEEDAIKVEAFPIPDHWPQIVGLDFGWDHPAAAARLAWDRDADVIYLTAAHRAREQTPVLFAPAVKAWGEWIPVAWPHDGMAHDKGSGIALAQLYEDAGLNMLEDKATHAPMDGEPEGSGGNGVEAGVLEMLDRMQTGRFKVFAHIVEFFEEFRLYHRKDGKIVKEMDDLISATRYGIMMKRFARVKTRQQSSRRAKGSWRSA